MPRARPTGPATAANVGRNARAERDRRRRWQPARDALWAMLDPIPLGRVGIVGAGNGDDLPLRRIAARADEVVLVDLDLRALRRARHAVALRHRRRVTLLEHDVTLGAADAIARGEPAAPDPIGLPGAPYDLVIGDLLYSQLLHTSLRPTRAAEARLTRLLVERLHASAPAVLHLHDALGWWAGHPQPFGIDAVLAASPGEALALIDRGRGPRECDPRRPAADLGHALAQTRVWRWPFAPDVDYLVCATLAASRLP